MKLGPLPDRQICDRRLILLVQGRDVRRGGRHMLAEHLFQHPHAPLHRAGAIGERGGSEYARHGQHSPAIAIAQPDLPHLGSLHRFLQAVNRSHGAVEVSGIAIDETDDLFVVTDDALKEQADFIIHRLAHPYRHLRKQHGIEDLALQTADAQPLCTEAVKQGPGTTIVQQTFCLGLQYRRLMQCSLVGQSHQFVIGHRSP